MFTYKLAFNFCRASALTFALLSGSAIAQTESGKDLVRQLDDAVMEYAYSKDAADLAIVNSLIASGARPDIKILWHATYYQRPDLVDRLLEFPIDVNQTFETSGETVLLTALKHGKDPQVSKDELHIVESLLKAGANPNVFAQGGTTTPLKAALEAQPFPQPILVKMLLRYGADPKLSSPQGFSPLMGKGATNIEVIKLLIAAGTDPYGVSRVASTPLHYVCTRSFELRDQPDPQAAERIALLHKKGTSIDALSPQQRPWPIGTPLAESAMSHNPDCIKALLDAGASKDAPAFTPEYALKDPEVKGRTVREHVLKSAETHPTLYSDAVVELFK